MKILLHENLGKKQILDTILLIKWTQNIREKNRQVK